MVRVKAKTKEILNYSRKGFDILALPINFMNILIEGALFEYLETPVGTEILQYSDKSRRVGKGNVYHYNATIQTSL